MLDYLCFFNFQIEKEHIRLLIWTWLGQCPENAPRSPLPEKRPRENCLPENYPPEIGPSGKLRCNLATMPAGMKTKKYIGKLCIWRPGHSYICPLHVHFIFAGVRKFSDFFDFGLHCSLRVSLILLYFISSRAWVEILHIKNCIKDLMVVMPSYFYKDNKYKTSWRRPF